MIRNRAFLFFLTFFFIVELSYPQVSDSLVFRVMSWNVENLFDTKHDSLKQDTEFLPDGVFHWNSYRLNKKLKDISSVIAAVGEGIPPALVGMCEVENANVLRFLTKYSVLKKMDYEYVVTESDDLRGIDVALLYQRSMFNLLSHSSIKVPILEGCKPTRDILHCTGRVVSGDTLDVFVCHYPSRRISSADTDKYRHSVSTLLKNYADSIAAVREKPHILIMGDFNANLSDRSLKPLAQDDTNNICVLSVETDKKEVKGTYKYNGVWEYIDHIFVSKSLTSEENRIHIRGNKMLVADYDFLLSEDNKYGGLKPFRTYLGRRYNYGISDHLPIYTDIIIFLK